jgi:LacI family transcriptional regulator
LRDFLPRRALPPQGEIAADIRLAIAPSSWQKCAATSHTRVFKYPAMLSKLVKQVESALVDLLNELPPQTPLPPEPQLAKRFNVSRHTIQTALGSLVSKEMVQRIKGKGTFPIQGEKSPPLLQRRARMLGLVISKPFTSVGYARLLAQSALEEANAQGYNLVLIPPEPKENIYRILDDPHVDGLIVLPGTRDQTLLHTLSERKKPICIVDHYSTSDNIDSVRADSEKGSILALRHLYQLGHRKIAFVNANNPELNPERLRGYERGMKQLGVFARPEWMVEGSHDLDGGAKATSQLLSLPTSKRPTAIIAFDTKMGYGVLKSIFNKKLRVPQDISMISLGGDVIHWLQKGMPRMTRVVHQLEKLGKLAVEHILERIKNPNLRRRTSLLPGQIEVNETTREAS